MGDEITDGGVEVVAENKITNTIVSKDAEYKSGNDFIEWLVEINLNQIDFGNAEIRLEDHLQEGLLLDKNSVKLYKLEMKADGTYEEIKEKHIVEGKVTVDYDILSSNKAVFGLGTGIKDAYLLRFITDIDGDRETNTLMKNLYL